MFRHRWNTNQVSLIPVPALAVVNVVSPPLENDNVFLRRMAMLPRPAPAWNFLEINEFSFRGQPALRVNQPFNPPLPCHLPGLLSFHHHMRRHATEVGLVVH